MKLLTVLSFVLASPFAAGQYTADWDSLDSRPLPQWYDDAKIGIFLHWGLYSVPSFGSEWFWKNWERDSPSVVEYMSANFRPGFTYQDFAPQFTAEFYDPDEWAELFEAAGARYVVLTSKHYEGFTMWPSKFSWGWSVADLGPKRDLLGDLAKSIRNKTDLHFGLYYSLYEWFNPLFLKDKANNFTTNDFVTFKVMPGLHEVIELYEPEVIWLADGGEANDWYWNSTAFLAWLFNDSPVKDTVVVNDRWGGGNIHCNHGSFYICGNRCNPGVLQTHKWENAMKLDKKSWGYNRKAKSRDYITIEELLTTMIKTISCGGNILVNAGPTHDGRIPPIMEERLRQFGSWLSVNGEAIYSSKPWTYQNDTITPGVWYTASDNYVYSTVLSWPKDETLTLASVTTDEVSVSDNVVVSMLGFPDEPLEATMTPNGLVVTFPSKSRVEVDWAWVIKLEGLKIKT